MRIRPDNSTKPKRAARPVAAQSGADDASQTSRIFKPTAPVKRRKLYEDVILRLEEMIHSEELKPGDFLPSERDLMQMFGVGRPAIREALFALSRMSLVEVANGERPRVSHPTAKTLLGELSGAARLMLSKPEGMHHFQQARALFESALTEEAARLATRIDVLVLERALAANKRSIDDSTQFPRTDVEFHLSIAKIPRNPLYTALNEAIVEWLVEQRAVSIRRPGAYQMAYDAHAEIFEAIKARDPDAARTAMRRHLDTIIEQYWEVKEAEK